MAIRPADAHDADTVQRVVVRAYQAYVARIGRSPQPMTMDYAALIQGGDVRVLTQDSAIVGVIVLSDRPDHLLIDNVAIDPIHQRKGYGKVLLAFAEQEARNRDHWQVRLYTNEAMTESLALYRSLGYRETHRATEDGYRRIYLSKAL